MIRGENKIGQRGNIVLIAIVAAVVVAGLLIWFVSRGESEETANTLEPNKGIPITEKSETVYDLAIYDLLISLNDSHAEQQVYTDQYPPPPERAEFKSISDPRASFVLTPYVSDHPAYTAPHPVSGPNLSPYSSADVIGKSCYYLLTDDRTFVIKLYYDIGYGQFGPEDNPPPTDDLRTAAISRLRRDLMDAGLENLRIVDPSENPRNADGTSCIDPVG